MADDPSTERLAQLEEELARMRAERREIARQVARVEEDMNAILWSRRYRFATLLSGVLHRFLPRFAWQWIAGGLRRVHPLLARRRSPVVAPTTPTALHELSILLAGSGRGELDHELTLPDSLSIVIPVHDAPEALEECLTSLTRHLHPSVEVWLVDDASQEERTRALLDDHATRPGFHLIRNERNLGYTQSANRGLAAARGDVLLLNSDTRLGPRGLELLALEAARDPKVASVTAVSNAAGAFSVPEADEVNELPPGVPFDDLARALAHGGAAGIEVPTGNGFCMYVRRAAWDEVGAFDEQAFPRGYGEENDWCMRAREAGWRHVVAGRVLVAHRRSASFGEERQQLAAEGARVLEERHPDYGSLVKEMQRSTALARMRESARRVLTESPEARPRPRVLVVAYQTSGGMPRSCKDLMHGLSERWESLLLFSDGQDVRLWQLEDGELVMREAFRMQEAWTVGRTHDAAYRTFLSGCLAHYSIELVHVRHLAGHGLDVVEVARDQNLPTLLSFHDFFLVCPTANLLDEKDRFCAGHCTPGKGTCRLPTRWAGDLPPLKHEWIHHWKAEVEERVLRNVEAAVTTTRSARDLIQSVYPSLDDERFEVIPHGRDLVQSSLAARLEGFPLRVLVLGELTPAKGGHYIAQIARSVGERVEWHFLGSVNPEFRGIGHQHGEYERDRLMERIEDIAPHVAGLFSICGETWSHTLTEAWAAGLPVVATSLGAFAERISARGGGWLVDATDPEAAARTLLAIAEDPGDWQRVQALANLEGESDIQEMSRTYGDLYDSLLPASTRP